MKSDEYGKFLGKLKEQIISARQRAYQTVNRQLVELYLHIGKSIYEKIEISKWGESIVERLSNDLQKEFPDMKGFSRENLWRMKKLYETYKVYPKLSPLVTELSWSHNLLILFQTQTKEEKEFYLKTCINEKWSRRELQRQIESSLYERFMLSKKTGKLIPKVKIENENPSVGLILCKSKNEEVVRIAISKVASPMKISTYRTRIIDRKLLKKKLHSLPLPKK